jgi:23S rRNA (cytidine2498-2'-O)-methyltransferase
VSFFVLALCHPGAEKALKTEAAAAGLRPAFQAKGLVTFKSDRHLDPAYTFKSGLARFQAAQCVKRAPGEPAPQDAPGNCVHVVDVTKPEAPITSGRAPALAELVRTVITGPGGASFVTTHRHDSSRSVYPANHVPLTQPPASPSRAWLKLEEAIARFQLDLKKGERALEIGSAPGGATLALLDRGLSVVGVDPNAMDQRILGMRNFQHVPMASTQLEPAEIPGPFHWLVVEVNVPPGTMLRGAMPFAAHHAATLRGAVFTLKLGTFEMVNELDSWRARIGLRLPGAEVLAGSRYADQQELCVVAVRRTG